VEGKHEAFYPLVPLGMLPLAHDQKEQSDRVGEFVGKLIWGIVGSLVRLGVVASKRRLDGLNGLRRRDPAHIRVATVG
jgi:hypothetical protein